MPPDPVNRLLLLAMPGEGRGLHCVSEAREIDRPAEHCLVLQDGTLLIGITGLGGSNMAALASRLLARHPGITHVANFGSAGAYPHAALPTGSLLQVSHVCKWDLHLPLSQFDSQFAPIELAGFSNVDEEIRRVICASGCSFSTAADRARPGFPEAEIEDMELYSLARLCQLHNVPLASLKFISNHVGESGIAEFEAEFSRALGRISARASAILDGWIAE